MNKEEKKEAVARSAVAGWYVTIVGLGLWRALGDGRRKIPEFSVFSRVATALEEGINRAKKIARETETATSESSVLAKLPPNTERGNRSPTQPQLQDLQASQGAEALDRLAQTADADFRKRDQRREPSLEKAPPFQKPEHSWSNDDELVARVLRYQRLEEPRLQGWSEPRPTKLPLPTYAPAIMAFSIVLFAMGLATIWYVCVIGAMVFAVAAYRWVDELQEE
jgi:hypothetical protein